MSHWGLTPREGHIAGWTHYSDREATIRFRKGLPVVCSDKRRAKCQKLMKCTDHPGRPDLLRMCRRIRIDMYTFVRSTKGT